MEEQVYKCASQDFPFDELSLANPQGLQGGAYLSKIKVDGKKLSLQTPRCTTKNGIIKTDKKIYCDLQFDAEDDTVREFFGKLEEHLKNLIFDKKDLWFHTDMDMDTIDYHWQQILRPYKGSKLLLRCNIKKPSRSRVTSRPTIQVYDEDETLLTIGDIVKGKLVMGLLHLNGLKFTSQSFSLDFYLEQAMLLKDRVMNNRCRIQIDSSFKNTPVSTNDNSPTLSSTSEDAEDDRDLGEDHKDDDVVESTNKMTIGISNAELSVTTKQEDGKEETPTVKKEEDLEDNVVSLDPTSNTKVDQNGIVVNDLAENDNDSLEKTNQLNEVILDVPQDEDSVKLKKPNEVYMEIYREVRRRAKSARKKAIEAYLEVKRIKSLYMLEEIEDSEDEDDILDSLEEDEQELTR